MATHIKKIRIAVSPYERAVSWVVSLNLLVGLGVGLLFLFWLSHVIVIRGEQTEIIRVEKIAGRGDHAAGFARDMEAPGIEELEEETEPQVEQLLEAVTDVVSTQAAALDNVQTTMFSSNTGTGVGDSRPPGPEGEGDDIIPRGERWEIQYNSNSSEAYSAQLDYFRIELGVVGGGQTQVDYAFNLRKSRPDSRQGAGGESEKRLYMLWSSGTLKRFDQQFLRAAGITTTNRIVMQFYPPEVENQLANIEMAYAEKNGKTSVKQIKKTVFGVRAEGNGYQFFVVSQQYRAVPV